MTLHFARTGMTGSKRKKGGQMKSTIFTTTFTLLITLIVASRVSAHCEIPCGIYDDELRIKAISEDAQTIEKAMRQIEELGGQTPVNYNQLIRWVTNKETHADDIQHHVSQYFLTQRIKPDSHNYSEKLATLHQILIESMKCKQTTDTDHVVRMRKLLEKFTNLYFTAGGE